MGFGQSRKKKSKNTHTHSHYLNRIILWSFFYYLYFRDRKKKIESIIYLIEFDFWSIGFYFIFNFFIILSFFDFFCCCEMFQVEMSKIFEATSRRLCIFQNSLKAFGLYYYNEILSTSDRINQEKRTFVNHLFDPISWFNKFFVKLKNNFNIFFTKKAKVSKNK